MTVTRDQTEEGQPSSPKVSSQQRLHGFCQMFILHWPGGSLYSFHLPHKHQTRQDKQDKAENMTVLVSLQGWI